MSATTVTVASTPATASDERQVERRAGGQRQRRARSRRIPGACALHLVGSDLQIGKAEAAVGLGDRFARDVGVGLARGDLAPGTTAPCGSTTRPLMLA